MGSGTFTASSFRSYSTNLGRSYDSSTGRVKGQTYVSRDLDDSLNPRNFSIRECCNSDEHPNTIPVILGLDVTGSMGEACGEVASALGVIMKNLYGKFKDIEFCIMGIGDLAYDNAPIQMSQFESDIRIAEALDKIYMEHGGGGNGYESYTAAWYMGLHHTKLDAFDKQNRKGIIITMGDEPLNPYLPAQELSEVTNDGLERNVETKDLYSQASKKFDIYHIAVDSPYCCYQRYKKDVDNSFGQFLGKNYKITNIDGLSGVVEDCISESITGESSNTTENNEISW